ncbi:MAG: DNA-3-methyladenine glycosylase 2 family protein [Bacteroidota bacterium]
MNKEIIECLSKDRKLKKIIDSVNIDLPPKGQNIYQSLIRAIIYQQSAGKAADAIFKRFKKAFQYKVPSPKKLANASIEDLRAVGLSKQKASYVQNVARFWIDEKLSRKDWTKMSNDAILKYLTQIKGVGPWTVQMLMMYTMHRYDIFPTGDYGIQMAMKQLYGI